KEQPGRLGRPPGPRFVQEDGRRVAQHRVHHGPGRLDRVLAREQRAVAVYGCRQQPLIRANRVWVMFGDGQLDVLTDHLFPWLFVTGANGDHDLGAEPEAYVVAAPLDVALAINVLGRPVKTHQHLGTSHRQALTGADVEGHVRPAPRIDEQPYG